MTPHPSPLQYPDDAVIRVRQLIGDPKARPPAPGLIPVTRSTIYYWMARGQFPRPTFRVGGVVGWRMADVRRWLDENRSR